jgi:peptidoglycan/xylan/chitin deacetylase (PgdA/CDA1 family)
MKQHKKRTAICGLIGFLIAILWISGGSNQAVTAQSYVPLSSVAIPTPTAPSAVYRVQTTKKIVALTFDISWGEQIPGPVLDVLQAKHVDKATFFLSGPWTLQHSEIAKRIKELGYEIGSHGYDQKPYTKFDDTWIETQVRNAEEAISQVAGKKPNLIRAPNGDIDKRVLTKLHSMGYTVIQWRTDAMDWKKTSPGDIIRIQASDAGKQTVPALPAILDGLRKQGFSFVTVSELLADTQIKSKLE